jgi:hypothetical protein
MVSDINQLPKHSFVASGGAPNPVFAEWYDTTTHAWKPFMGAPQYPWKNFNEINRSWLRGDAATWRYFAGEVGSNGGLTIFRVKK